MVIDLVTFETAKLAKEKGWGIDKYGNVSWDFAYYICEIDDYWTKNNEIGDLIYTQNRGTLSNGQLIADAPVQSVLQKWLREKYKIQIEVRHYVDDDIESYDVTIHEPKTWNEKDVFVSQPEFKTYELALENGLYEALKLLS
jgi:hypothetical protein